MLTILISLALQTTNVSFAKPVIEAPRPVVRIYVHPRTIDDALAPFNKPPMKCVPRPSHPMTDQEKWLQEATAQKLPGEVEEYLACYADKDRYPKFRGMIELAAKDFGVDPSLMKCLLLRESQFDSSMVSCTCAMGLGQQTSDNLEGMRGTVNATLSGPAWIDYMNTIRRHDPEFTKYCTGEFKRSDEETNQSSSFYQSVMKGRERGCGKSPTECKVFRQDDRRCPAASIAASAAYLKYIDSIVRKAVNCGQLEQWQIPDSRIALALAYNAGEGTFLKAIKRANDENTTISINFLDGAVVSSAKLDEMRMHYRALRMCLHTGETDGPSVKDHPKPGCFKSAPVQQVNGSAGAIH